MVLKHSFFSNTLLLKSFTISVQCMTKGSDFEGHGAKLNTFELYLTKVLQFSTWKVTKQVYFLMLP